MCKALARCSSFRTAPPQGQHLEHVRLLSHADLAANAGDDAALEQRPDGQEVVAHGRQPVALVFAGVVMHQLAFGQVAQVTERAAVPAMTQP